MSDTAPDRLTRMLALVTYLHDHPGIDIDRVAEHFGATRAQILDDVNTLWVSGTPGYLHDDLIDFAGSDLEHGVLTLLDSRDMDRPLRLSSGEATALLVALHSMKAAIGDQEQDLIDSTISALHQAAGTAAKAAEAVQLAPAAGVAQRVAQIRDALAGRRRLRISYVSASDTTSVRDVDPLQVLSDGQRWFLLGWCYRAQDQRQFRIDRILQLEVLQQVAADHSDLTRRAGTEPDVSDAAPVRLELASRARWVAEQLPDAQVHELADGWFALTVGVVDEAWLANLVFALGPDVRALQPPELAHALSQRAAATLAAYRDFADQEQPPHEQR